MRRVSVALGIASDVEDRSRSLLSERFDICILLGDLNYRLEMEVPEIKQLLAMAEKMDSNFGQQAQSDIISPSPSLRRQSQLDTEASLDVTDQQRDIEVRSMRLEINQLKKIDKTQSDKAEDGDGDGDGDEDRDEDGVPEFHKTEYRLVILNIIHT